MLTVSVFIVGLVAAISLRDPNFGPGKWVFLAVTVALAGFSLLRIRSGHYFRPVSQASQVLAEHMRWGSSSGIDKAFIRAALRYAKEHGKNRCFTARQWRDGALSVPLLHSNAGTYDASLEIHERQRTRRRS